MPSTKRKKKLSTQSTTKIKDNSLSSPSPSERIKFLGKKHKKVLTQVKRKRTELENFTTQMRDVASEMFQKGTPLYDQARKMDQEIHELFEEILTKRRLGKSSKQEIEEVYQMLQLTGKISPNPDAFQTSEQEDEDSEEDFDFDPDDFFGGNRQGFHQREEEWEDVSAPRPTGDIRKLFLRLAERFHPDKVVDEKTRAHFTEIMKEINIAYRSGDFARLLEIDSQSETTIEVSQQSGEGQECIRLEKEIEVLKEQYEKLKGELQKIRYTPQGEMVKEYRRAEKAGENLIDLFLGDAKTEVADLEEIRDFVQAFRNKKITIKKFIQGPASAFPENELDAMLAELFEGGVRVR